MQIRSGFGPLAASNLGPFNILIISARARVLRAIGELCNRNCATAGGFLRPVKAAENLGGRDRASPRVQPRFRLLARRPLPSGQPNLSCPIARVLMLSVLEVVDRKDAVVVLTIVRYLIRIPVRVMQRVVLFDPHA